MYIRCAECQAATWLETLAPGEVGLSIACKSCKHEYSLLAAGELGVTADEQHQRALQFAEFNQIDLPSAYSVLLGFMDLEDAKQARGDLIAKHSEPGDTSATPEALRLPLIPEKPSSDGAYDPGFEPSVAAGRMTAQEALTRGDRRVYVAQLARRHSLTMHLAELVADNKMSLHSAARRIRGEGDGGRPPLESATSRQKKIVLGLTAGLILAAFVHAGSVWTRSLRQTRAAAKATEVAAATRANIAAERVAQTATPVSRTKIKTDENGDVVEVVGRNPSEVLFAYCDASKGTRQLQPLELTSTVPPSSGTRLGLLRNFDEVDGPYAITIRQDRKSRTWVAGNGEDPLVPSLAPAFPEDAMRVPVSR